jgi:hypothetical protein
LRLAAHQQQFRRQHRRASDVGDRQGYDERLALDVFLRRSAWRGENHAQGDQEQDHAAGDGQGRLGDAQHREQRLAEEEEGHHHAVGDQ